MRARATGANGFIGRARVRRLLADGLGGPPVEQLVASDLALEGPPADPRVRAVTGSIAESGVLEQALARPVQVVFHRASVPGAAAEKAPVLGRRVDLDATLRLVDLLREQGNTPRFVFASTVAVYRDPLPAVVHDDTPARPVLSYGAHKRAAEVMRADATRRGWLQACSLRLPGVVARPGDGAGLVSAFMSPLFWTLRAGEPTVLPVAAEGCAWWILAGACVDNLLHAATLDPCALDARGGVQMPALRLSMQQVVDALARADGADRRSLVRHAPQAWVQRLFAAYPPREVPVAEALGFRHDGTVDDRVRRATAA